MGQNSFIARSWSSRFPDSVHLLPRTNLSQIDLAPFDVVVNCAISSELKTERYLESNDMDLAVARLAEKAGRHFIMLSTRKVYGAQNLPQPLTETSSLLPADHYGTNKLRAEENVRAVLGERCTVLRIANVFGYELGRESFLGKALNRLKAAGQIELDVSPFVVRDFMPLDFFFARMMEICASLPAGIFNLGSSIGLPLGRLAQWIIRGYGRGQLVVTSLEERDNFVLCTEKLAKVLAIGWPPIDFETTLADLGLQLAKS